jgi:two-component system chemotaxis sensor kinase CheA
VEAPLKVKRGTENEAYVGSMVIAGKTTDVVDVGFLLRGMIDDLLLADLDITGNSRSAKIMLVEDSIFFRKLTIPLLSNVGYKVTDYPDPIEALEGLRNAGEIDLIVTDIEMPGMDGFQFAERVREDERYDHIPIIAFTSTMNNHFSARAKQVGMSDLILKTDREALLTSIQKQLDNVREMV